MHAFIDLLRRNRNYRYTWSGQVVSEIGDHFNNIAVFSLALANTRSGLVVTGVMLARAIPAVMAGPLAGVMLDRFDRRKVMIASDLVRFVVALGFILTVDGAHTWLLYVLSGLLMGASPFFTSGRSSVLPKITTPDELHTANSLTQTTGWTTLTIGTMTAGIAVAEFGYPIAFTLNALSFLASAYCIWKLRLPEGGFRAGKKQSLTESDVARPWHEYTEGLRYMKARPLLLGIALVGVGWASGGGAAQILFSLFGEIVFNRGPQGIGIIWGCAGLGLIIGGAIGHRIGPKLSFEGYKRTIGICYIVHGGAYVIFSQMPTLSGALVFIALSRTAVAVSSVLNMTQVLRIAADEYRGRVFATLESLTWFTMLLSMTAAGIASQHFPIRTIAAVAGVLSSMTAVYWYWANATGRLPKAASDGVARDEVEVHGEPTV